MMTKWAGVLLGALCFFSCGDLPETKPNDWNNRLNFTDKPYEGTLFSAWGNDVTPSAIADSAGDRVQSVNKSQRWKGSSKFSSDVPVYYIFKAANSVTVTIDWEYRRDNGIGFAYKKVGTTVGNYGIDSDPIAVGQNEYLVMRISPPTGFSSSAKTDWEIGFTVN